MDMDITNFLRVTFTLLLLILLWRSMRTPRKIFKGSENPKRRTLANIINMAFEMYISNPGLRFGVQKESQMQYIYKKYLSSDSGYSNKPFHVKLFGKRLVTLVFDRETIHKIEKSDAFALAPKAIAELYSGGDMAGILMNRGKSWKEIKMYTKKKLTEFGLGKKDAMIPLLTTQFQSLVDNIEDIKKTTGNKIQVHSLFAAPSLNLFANVCGGVNFSDKDSDFMEAYNMAFEITNLPLSAVLILLVFTKLRFLWKIFGFHRLLKIRDRGFQLVRKYIDSREALGVYKENPEVVLDFFLQEIEKRKNDEEMKTIYCKRQLEALVADLVAAGMVTSSNLLESLVMFMCLYTDVQRRVQKEIDTAIDPNSLPIYHDYKARMPYTLAMIYEVHRMSNVIPIVPRVATKSVEIGGHVYEKEELVACFAFPLRFDDTYWKDPEVFNPDRYLDGNGNFVQEKADHMLFFGAGPRNCPGKDIAKEIAFTFGVGLLQKYAIKKACDSETLCMRDRFSVANQPEAFHVSVFER